MPQLIALGLVGGLAWYAYRAFKRQMANVSEELKKNEKAKTAKKAKKDVTKTIDELELGKDGVYRPKDITDKK